MHPDLAILLQLPFHKCWSLWKEQDKQMFWEVLKLRIRGITIPYCATLKRNRIKKESELEQKIKN